MKVVINNCYGGFSLSDEAIERCISLGMKATKYSENGYENPEANFVKTDKKGLGDNLYYCMDDNENSFRCNPIVIRVIEELGEKADGFCSKLKIIDIPFDSIEGWVVEEYDGMESIEAIHQSWS